VVRVQRSTAQRGPAICKGLLFELPLPSVGGCCCVCKKLYRVCRRMLEVLLLSCCSAALHCLGSCILWVCCCCGPSICKQQPLKLTCHILVRVLLRFC
jgi:hypothetical protein